MQNSSAVIMKSDWGGNLASSELPSSQMLHVLSSGLPSLYRCAYKLLRNKADAEDAVQDALLAAHKHLNQFRGDARMSTWVTTIVINCEECNCVTSPRATMNSCPWIQESEKIRSTRSTRFWRTVDPIQKMSATSLI